MWNTKLIELVYESFQEGFPMEDLLNTTPFYRGDRSLRKANLEFKLTYEEADIISYLKDPQGSYEDSKRFDSSSFKIRGNNYPWAEAASKMTPQEFLVNVIKYQPQTRDIVRDDNGMSRDFELYDFQKEFFAELERERLLVVVTSRQMGYTMMSAIVAMHYAMINHDKNFVYVSPTGAGCENFIDKVKEIYNWMPFYMKPGIVSWNVNSVKFDNDCRIMARSASSKAAGCTIDYLWMDDAAHIHESTINSLFPAIMDNTKVVISSAPHGINWFYKLYQKSGKTSGKNGYRGLMYHYSLYPGRDLTWKNNKIAEFGSLSKFQEEYDLSFQNLTPHGLRDYQQEIVNSVNGSIDIKFEKSKTRLAMDMSGEVVPEEYAVMNWGGREYVCFEEGTLFHRLATRIGDLEAKVEALGNATVGVPVVKKTWLEVDRERQKLKDALDSDLAKKIDMIEIDFRAQLDRLMKSAGRSFYSDGGDAGPC